ncbi:restriction endonuclease subunit S [Actinoplanes sp. TFC3]|uniref:restriction endonuclease subunit S n=1 Tax=Actinoplanes sp. TFC3 TaxID=1710355 RepID=UPI000830EA7F|nr:restriction endonuclease subunit S [Actinoplanes sp. TFC3]
MSTTALPAPSKTRLGWLFQPVSDRGHKEAMVLSVYRDHGVVPKDSRTDNFNRTPENLSNYQLVQPGDLVVNRMKAWQGSLGISEHQGIVSPDYEVLRPTVPNYDRRFLHSLLRSRALIDQYALRSTGIRPSQWRLYWDEMKTIEISLPTAEQQRAIADYLDRETARIDTLIEEQQRLIEMLGERRQAVIDESFSTLGEPSVQLRRHIDFLTSGSRGWGDYYADQGERFLRIGNLPRANLKIRGDIQFVDLPSNVTEGSRTMLQEGDLLFSITAYLGSVAVVEGDWVGAYVSQHVALCRLERDQVDPRFIGWFMLTTTGQDQLNEGAAGGTKMQLALDDIRGLRVPTAPIEQQRGMVAHLDRQTTQIDALVAETERFIDYARERRAALITAAVTGEIDVREMA